MVKGITVSQIGVIGRVLILVVNVVALIVEMIKVMCHNFLFSIRKVLHTGKSLRTQG